MTAWLAGGLLAVRVGPDTVTNLTARGLGPLSRGKGSEKTGMRDTRGQYDSRLSERDVPPCRGRIEQEENLNDSPEQSAEAPPTRCQPEPLSPGGASEHGHHLL